MESNFHHPKNINLEPPQVVDPGIQNWPWIKVKELTIREEEQKPEKDWTVNFTIIAWIAGIVAGMLLYFTWGRVVQNSPDWPSLGIFIFCAGWGFVLGFAYSFLVLWLFKRFSDPMPAYAMLSFLPLILILLVPVLIWITMALKIVLAIAIIIVLAKIFLG